MGCSRSGEQLVKQVAVVAAVAAVAAVVVDALTTL